MENKRKIGAEKEEQAVSFLIEKGFRILDRNFYFQGGELDIVAKDKEYLVFVEVKYRKNTVYGFPEEAITAGKQKKLVLGAKKYMYEHKISYEVPCRFDVISICGDEIVWIENAFCLT